MTNRFLSINEEHVTRQLAKSLAKVEHEIIAVHPPDGQGPFVIPKPKVNDDIERSSFHPDVVSLSFDKNGKLFLYISECKVETADLKSDREKLTKFARDKDSLLYAFFRCQTFPGGPEIGFNFDEISILKKEDLPIRFILAAASDQEILDKEDLKIEGFDCRQYLFSYKSLLDD
jgi:hypothetical protein